MQDSEDIADDINSKKDMPPVTVKSEEKDLTNSTNTINIIVNGDPVVLEGKPKYILVDVLDFYPVDTSVAHGDHLETSVNGMACDFTMPVKDGDVIRIEWVER